MPSSPEEAGSNVVPMEYIELVIPSSRHAEQINYPCPLIVVIKVGIRLGASSGIAFSLPPHCTGTAPETGGISESGKHDIVDVVVGFDYSPRRNVWLGVFGFDGHAFWRLPSFQGCTGKKNGRNRRLRTGTTGETRSWRFETRRWAESLSRR
jgi:hypothetical protein